MKSIKVSGGRAIICFNPEFYTKKSILHAARDFGSMCNIKLEENSVLKVILTPKGKTQRKEMETIAYEFCNYILAEMKNKGEV